jgi:hypothetical protein
MGLVVVSDEVDYGDVALLAVAMATPDALFNALRIPWEIVVDYRVALRRLPCILGPLNACGTRERERAEEQPHGSAWFPAGSVRLPPLSIARAPAAPAHDR